MRLGIAIGVMTIGAALLVVSAVMRPPDPTPGRGGPWRWLRDHVAQLRRPKPARPTSPPLPRRHGIPAGHPEHACGAVGGHLWTLQQQLWPDREYHQIEAEVRAEKHRGQT